LRVGGAELPAQQRAELTRELVVLLFVPFLTLMLAQKILRRLLGPQAAGQVVGTWMVRFFDALFSLPSAILRRLQR